MSTPASGGPKPLSFASRWIEAVYVASAKSLAIGPKSIVINLSSTPQVLDHGSAPLRPWRSTILADTTLSPVQSLLVIRVKDEVNIGSLTQHWKLFGSTLPPGTTFPLDTPLWISSQDSLGMVDVDPRHFTGEAPVAGKTQPYELKVNLWYSPPHTDCYIHTGHKFLEVHTQVHGVGRMQKFRKQEAASLYEEVWMPVGLTHECFAIVNGSGLFYPWHRYYADTDCIWLAIELHAQ